MVHAFQQMKRIGYQLENVSLHYRGNQGLDMIFRTADGQLALVSSPTYAVVEAKHSGKLDSLAIDKNGYEQGSQGYNRRRLNEYLKRGDGTQRQLAKNLLSMMKNDGLKSYAAFYGKNSLYELVARHNDDKKSEKTIVK